MTVKNGNYLMTEIFDDIKKIWSVLGSGVVEKIGLFGSCIRNFDNANDIDIVVFSKNLSIGEAKSRLLSIKTNYPIKAKYINGSYSSITNEGMVAQKYYHIIVLSDDEAKSRFVDMNEGKIQYFDI